MDSSDGPHGESPEKHFERLVEVGTKLLSEHDLEVVLTSVVEEAKQLTSARYAALGVLDRDRTELERFIHRGIDDETRSEIGILPRGQGVLGELIRRPKPLRLADVNVHPHAYGFPPGHPEMHTFLGVPIAIKGEAFGNLYMTEKVGGAEFDELDEAAAMTLATWAGIAIENAYLYTNLSEREIELEQALRSSETSVDIARAIGGETDVERILDLIVKRARALVEARSLLVLLRRDGKLTVAAHAGLAGAEMDRLDLPPSDPVFKGALAERAPFRLWREESGGGQLSDRFGAEEALVVPLLFRGRSVGALVALDRETGGSFDEEDFRLLQAFGSSAAMAVATAQSIKESRLQQQIDVVERERRRWAQELHDGTLQDLVAVRMNLATELQREGDDRSARIERVTLDAVDQLETQVDELSRLIDDLRPANLERESFEVALEVLVQESSSRSGVRIDARIDPEVATTLGREDERQVYRLVQEALTNVIKHASATHVVVSVFMRDDHVEITITDDGSGFNIDHIEEGRGLRGMHERIELLDGAMEVRSVAGRGTEITARIPIRVI